MLAPGKGHNAVAVGIGSSQHHRAMATNVATTCLLLGFALLCGLQNIEGHPGVDPPMPGMRRAVESMSAESDEMMDDTQMPPAPPVSPVGPSLNPLLPLIMRMKPGKLVDPTQFIQMKAELLKNLLGPGGVKSPVARYVARAVSSKGSKAPSKWAGGAAWAAAAGQPAPGNWGTASQSAKTGKPAAPAAAQPSPWDWPPPTPAPAAPAAQAPQAPMAPMAPMAPQAPAPAAPSGFPSVPGYWIPSNILPVPADPTDKKAALVEALLDQLLSTPAPPMQPMPSMNAPMRLARAPASAGLSELLDSLNLTVPAALPTLKPTIEPPGFWFPSYVPAAPGSLTPYVVDPTAQIAKKTKFLSDLFASKAMAAAAAAAASPAASPSSSLTTRGTLLQVRAVDPSEYTAKVSAYIDSLVDSTSTAKRASGMAPTKKQMKTMKGTKQASKVAMPAPAAAAPAAPAMNTPMMMEEATEDESEGPMLQLWGLRKKREIEDETEADMTDDASPADVAAKTAAILADMATVKQNILVQLDAMSKTEMAASKSIKLATKAATKKGSTIAALLGITIPTPAPIPPSAVLDYQPKIAVLTNIYSQLSDSLKNLTSAPDAMDPLNPDKLFIAAVNARVTKIMMRNALLPAAAPKVARSSNSWQRWRGQQDSDAASQYEGDSETNRRQKSAVPLVAAVFAPQTTHYMSRQPSNW